jgi:membrane-anchored protein YejM (alkaline phosphatase superfamily)
MVPLSCLGVIYLFLEAIGTFQIQGFAAALLVALLLIWYYRWLVRKLDFCSDTAHH